MYVKNHLSFKTLHLLTVVAEHGSLIGAADALCISASAVSHQIKRLEERIGFAITQREGKTLTLTPNALRYANELKGYFDSINKLTNEFLLLDTQQVSLGVESAFAVNRLIPALSLWQSDLNGLDVRVRMLNCDDNPVDLGLDMVFGNQLLSKGYECEQVKAEQYFAVCTPEYKQLLLASNTQITADAFCLKTVLGAATHSNDTLSNDTLSNATLSKITWLELDRVNGWETWCGLKQVSWNKQADVTYFSHTLLLFKAALNHQGIALLEGSLIKDELATGKLILLDEDPMTLPELNYYLSVHSRHASNPIIKKLKALLVGLL